MGWLSRCGGVSNYTTTWDRNKALYENDLPPLQVISVEACGGSRSSSCVLDGADQLPFLKDPFIKVLVCDAEHVGHEAVQAQVFADASDSYGYFALSATSDGHHNACDVGSPADSALGKWRVHTGLAQVGINYPAHVGRPDELVLEFRLQAAVHVAKQCQARQECACRLRQCVGGVAHAVLPKDGHGVVQKRLSHKIMSTRPPIMQIVDELPDELGVLDAAPQMLELSSIDTARRAGIHEVYDTIEHALGRLDLGWKIVVDVDIKSVHYNSPVGRCGT